jgi:hypothetical protein
MPEGKFMDLSGSIFSDDYFFIVGMSELLTPELIDENYCIIDIETICISEVRKNIIPGKKLLFLSATFLTTMP